MPEPTPTRRAALSAILIPLAAALALVSGAGCGSQASTAAKTGPAQPATSAAPQRRLAVDAEPNALKFTSQQLTAAGGKVTIVMHNPSALEHNIAIKGGGVDVGGKVVGHGGTSTVTADLKPGDYTFYCAVPGHAQAGMTGTLHVR
jgi:uncharacterized cupredoxin-like copper-binding protein